MALRQPGSSFKPFAYAAALKRGYTPNTIVYDVPTEFNPTCHWLGKQEVGENGQKCYNPRNYDGAYYGPMTFKDALAQSRNVPAVKVLYLAGIENTLDLAQRMGINSLKNRADLGLSLVLGGADITLLEETAAFGVFAAQGEKNAVSFILRIEDKDGNVLEEYRKNSQKVLDTNIANQISYMLSKNEFRAPVFGEQSYLNIPGLPTAVKTGTTQNFRDAWTVGYTPNISAGVWVGNNNNLEMANGADGSVVAAPIWNRFMRLVYEKKQNEPKELKEKNFYFALPAFGEQPGFSEPIIEKTSKAVLDGVRGMGNSILHYINKDNPRAQGNSINDPQYQNWENAVRAWVRSRTPPPKETQPAPSENEIVLNED
jgi:membrane peptidoglycan carboxypeptidase